MPAPAPGQCGWLWCRRGEAGDRVELPAGRRRATHYRRRQVAGLRVGVAGTSGRGASLGSEAEQYRKLQAYLMEIEYLLQQLYDFHFFWDQITNIYIYIYIY